MEDKKSTAVVAGIVVGALVVGAAIAAYYTRPHESEIRDIDDIVDQARSTVQRLDEAVELLRKSAGARAARSA